MAGAGKPAGGAKPADSPASAEAEAAVAEGEAAKGEKKPEDPKFAARFASLAKREDTFRKEREAYEAEKKATAAKFAGYDKLRETAQKDPVEAFRLIGGYADKQTAAKAFIRAAAGKGPTPEEKIEALERERAEEKRAAAEAERKKQEEQHQKELDAAVTRFRGEIAAHIDSAPDQFKYLRLENTAEDGKYDPSGFGTRAVYRVVELKLQKTGTIMSISDAAKEVEAALAKKAQRLKGLEATPEQTAPATEPAPTGKSGNPKQASPKAPASGQRPKTLSSAHAAASAPSGEAPARKLTRNERIEAAIAKHSRRQS